MNKRVLISGASRGLGLCFAKKYLEDGCIVFAGARNEGAAGLKELKEKYGLDPEGITKKILSWQQDRKA